MEKEGPPLGDDAAKLLKMIDKSLDDRSVVGVPEAWVPPKKQQAALEDGSAPGSYLPGCRRFAQFCQEFLPPISSVEEKNVALADALA